MLDIEPGHFFCSLCLFAWYEDRHFGHVVIRDSHNGVKSLRHGQFCYPIDGDGREGGGIMFWGNGEQGRSDARGICFVCLTDCTAPYVLLYEFLHFGPPVVLGNGKKSAGYPWMTRSGGIVVLSGYLPPKVVVFHNNEAPRVPPVMIM